MEVATAPVNTHVAGTGPWDRMSSKTPGAEEKLGVDEGTGPSSCSIWPQLCCGPSTSVAASCLSPRSEAAIQRLGETEGGLCSLEWRLAQLDGFARGSVCPSVETISKSRTELALLEAEAHKLETAGIDNVYTSELVTGQTSAKASKKEQLRRLEALLAQTEQVFQALDVRHAEAQLIASRAPRVLRGWLPFHVPSSPIRGRVCSLLKM